MKKILNKVTLAVFSTLFLTSCETTKSIVTAPIKLLGSLVGAGSTPEQEPDPYAMWQEYAIYIIIGGIVMGVIDFMMDRKLSLIGPAIIACGAAVSVWGVALGIIDAVLPWLLGLAAVAWVAFRVMKAYKKSTACNMETEND
jgi:hypothetical protein